MQKVDFWELSERIRMEVPHDYMILHPRLCEEDGEALMENLIKMDTVYITPACAEKRQAKLLAAGFERAGVPMDENHWVPVSMAQKSTTEVFEEVKAIVEQLKVSTE